MATLTIPWNDGNGDIILTYTGQGDGVVIVRSSTDNLGDDRRQVLTFRTVGQNSVSVQVAVVQPTGMQVLLDSNGNALRTIDGKVLRVMPEI
ncbi:MAG: hypothetical protein IKK92_03920 [Prevotella sp.]|nr:hypothetical protein [Prevotella sp.]MBR6605002.1 hypothetical protein [Prevotella sp.]